MSYELALLIAILICYPIWELAQWFKARGERRKTNRTKGRNREI